MSEHLTPTNDFLIDDEMEVFQDKCGLLVMYSKTPKHILPLAVLAAGGGQHRGQQGVGLGIRVDGDIKIHTDKGLINEVFNEDTISQWNYQTNFVKIHTRYGTNGGYGGENLQPCKEITPEGEPVTVIHNGEFVATNNIREKINEEIHENASDTVLFTKLLAQTPGKNHDEKVLKTLTQVDGAYSLVIAMGDDVYLVRDGRGIRPFVVGVIDGTVIAASETIALDKVGATILGEVNRGQVIRINQKGMRTIKPGYEGPGNLCDFEWDYVERPDSRLPAPEQMGKNIPDNEWPSILSFREKCGLIIAQENPIPNATFITGIPDSGVAVATGFAIGANIPYRQTIIRDHYDQNGAYRLFQQDQDMEEIGSRVLGKLSMVKDARIWKDAVVVFGDDSIVRSKVSGKITRRARELGAKEVYWIVGFPQVRHPCHLGVSTRSYHELIAARHGGDVKKIAEEIDADGVYYISNEGFIRAKSLNGEIIVPKNRDDIFLVNGGCGGCVTGNFPINKDGSIYEYEA